MAFVHELVKGEHMEILTLLKANIKKKKSTFISVALLMMIVVSTATAILSTRNNYLVGIQRAYVSSEVGDTVIIIKSGLLSEELMKSVETASNVKEVRYNKVLTVYGVDCGSAHDSDMSFLQKMHDGIKLYNDDKKSFCDNIPALGHKEAYLPLGLKDTLNCNIGDTIIYGAIDGSCEFKIKGFVQEPSMGAQTIGWKNVFISDSDFDSLNDRWKLIDNDGSAFDYTMISVYMEENCGMTSGKFQRELNLETKITDLAEGALTREQTERFSTLVPDILTELFIVFVAFLFIIVLILISHSISTEIESEYVTFGILKSQGYSKNRLMNLFFAQYLSAELLGVVSGIILSIPLETALTQGCQTITGIMPERGLSLSLSLLLIGIILLLSSALIFIKALPLGKISPVTAINGGKNDIYFDSRLKLPISKKALTASLAVRHLTSAKRRYISTVLISSILIFFMLTINLVINILTSKNALTAIGAEFSDVVVGCRSEDVEDYFQEIEDLVSSSAEIEKIYRSTNIYLSVNGENLMAHIVKEPENLVPILKGRAPIYENETIITEMVADLLELKPGDKVTVSHGEKEAEYLISGIYQSTNDSGMCFSMSEKAVRKIYGNFKIMHIGFSLADSSKADEILDLLNEKYEGNDDISVEKYDLNSFIGAGITDIIWLMRVLIYIFSIIFALVAVKMICTRSFIQERTDIGICKAIGFTVKKLRLSFGIRFWAVSVIGTTLGITISLMFSSKLLGLGLSLMGISHLPTQLDAASIILSSVVLMLCFFFFAYQSSGKIKKVSVRELTVE